MRRTQTILALLAGAALSVACEQDRETNARHSPPAAPSIEPNAQTVPAVVFLGDSLTAGRGLAESDALPALIDAKLKGQGLAFTVVNAGRSGDTTAGGRSRLKWYLRDRVNTWVLVIGLGSNDAMRGQPLAAIEENLRQIIREARAARPEVVIYLWELKTFPNMGAEYGAEYEALFPRVAKEERIELLPFPLAGVAADPKLNQSDGIHPSVEGTRIVANNIWRTLQPKLQELAKRNAD